jgi:hypothetical protein
MLIAYRELTYAPRGLPRVKIPIRMFAPEDVGGAYKCRFEIDWPENPIRSHAEGGDEFQALDLTQKMIALTIYHSRYHASGRLWLNSPGRGYGFPIIAQARDLLVGDDKKMFG